MRAVYAEKARAVPADTARAVRPVAARGLVLAALIWCALGCGTAAAEVSVSGDASHLVVEAANAAAEEVVAAIGETLEIELTPPAEVEGGTINGTYAGPLATVLRALMPKASFVVTRRVGDDRGLMVRFLGAPDEAHAATARPAARRAGQATEEDDPNFAEDPQAAADAGEDVHHGAAEADAAEDATAQEGAEEGGHPNAAQARAARIRRAADPTADTPLGRLLRQGAETGKLPIRKIQ